MSVLVIPTFSSQRVIVSGGQGRCEAVLNISGLTAGSANTVAHGLPRTPSRVVLVSSALGLWGETSAADDTNIYITVGSGGATSGKAYVRY